MREWIELLSVSLFSQLSLAQPVDHAEKRPANRPHRRNEHLKQIKIPPNLNLRPALLSQCMVKGHKYGFSSVTRSRSPIDLCRSFFVSLPVENPPHLFSSRKGEPTFLVRPKKTTTTKVRQFKQRSRRHSTANTWVLNTYGCAMYSYVGTRTYPRVIVDAVY